MRCLFSLAAILTLGSAVLALAQGDPVDDYLRQLESTDVNARIAAMVKLGELGPKAEKAAPALLKIFDVKNEDLRLNAALALGKIGKPAVPGLIDALKGPDSDRRYYILSALGWIGPAAKDAGPAVADTLGDARPDVRRKAVFALGAIAPEPKTAVKELIRALSDSSADVRLATVDALAQFGGAAVPELVPLLRGGRQVAVEAAKALGKIGPEAKPAIPILKDWLSLNDAASAQVAADTLAHIGKDAVPVISEVLKGKDGASLNPGVQRALILGLAKMGAEGAPALVDALGFDQLEVRQLAAQQLGTMKIGDKMVVIALAFLLKDANDSVKLAAARALQQIGPAAKPAAPALLGAVGDSSPQVRQAALQALRMVGGEPAVMLPALKNLIKDNDPVVRRQAIQLLPAQGSAAVPLVMEALRDTDALAKNQALVALQALQGDLRPAFDTLKELAKDPNLAVRRAVMLALGRTDAQAVPILLDAYTQPDTITRRNILQALRNLGPAATKATPKLTEWLEKENTVANRRLIVSALVNIDDGGAKVAFDHVRTANDTILWNQTIQASVPGKVSAKIAVPFLIDGLKSGQPNLRVLAVNQLAAYGPAAKEALPALRGLAIDNNPTLRAAVETAIKQIESK